ncbi:hypothetical protein BH10PLA2_BH10PLA2_08840 [soil metagenome]
MCYIWKGKTNAKESTYWPPESTNPSGGNHHRIQQRFFASKIAETQPRGLRIYFSRIALAAIEVLAAWALTEAMRSFLTFSSP